MPKGKKKKFIDKAVDNVVTFSLVHRSQKDPLVADENAPQKVLVPTVPIKRNASAKEEERKYGVFFDDEYDYMQHLKQKEDLYKDFTDMDEFLSIRRKAERVEKGDLGEGSRDKSATNNLQLPSSVFASNVEEDVGVLNRAAPRSGPLLDWDPDIVETLDDDYEHEKVLTLQDEEDEGENELDDDFMAKAMEGVGDGDDDDDDDEDCDEKDFNSDFDGDFEDNNFAGEEVRSKFTEYSMSSSVVPRSENLRTLDDKFDKFFEEYLEENIGGLDYDEIGGYKDARPETMKQILDDYKKQIAAERQKPDLKMTTIREEYKYTSDNEDADDKSVDTREAMERVAFDVERKEDKFDCESIISTYSNIYNHPKLIEEPSIKKKVGPTPITISGKTGMPKDVFGKGLTASALKQLQLELSNGIHDEPRELETATLASRVSQLSIRPQHETLEEKKERKLAVKELRRERRVEKKLNKVSFREEQARQIKAASANRGNAKGVTKIT